jgi:hypothetical protein
MTEQQCDGNGGMDGADETDEILLALEGLIERATSPVVRLCLEEAHADIAHLTGRDDGHSDAGQAAAA